MVRTILYVSAALLSISVLSYWVTNPSLDEVVAYEAVRTYDRLIETPEGDPNKVGASSRRGLVNLATLKAWLEPNGCNFHTVSKTIFKVNALAGTVTYRTVGSLQIGKYENCAIVDAQNWSCIDYEYKNSGPFVAGFREGLPYIDLQKGKEVMFYQRRWQYLISSLLGDTRSSDCRSILIPEQTKND